MWQTPAFSAALAISAASCRSIASGFSQNTCFPAEIAARAIGAWRKFGVAMMTACASSRFINSV
jgi:hypothetical protein